MISLVIMCVYMCNNDDDEAVVQNVLQDVFLSILNKGPFLPQELSGTLDRILKSCSRQQFCN